MYFGEFLINRKVINEDQLLDALIYQIENLPSFLRVLREEKIISPAEILSMIQLQLGNNSDLVSVLRIERKVDDAKLGELYKKQVLNRKLLGSVLIELKIVDQAIIEKMLHEFLSDKSNLINIAKPLKVEVKAEVEVEMSQAALDSMRELGFNVESLISETNKVEASENIFVNEFLELYSEKLFKKISKILSILTESLDDDSDISNYFSSLYRDLLLLKGSKSLAELTNLNKLLIELTDTVENKVSSSSDHLKEWGINALPKIEEVINFSWELRELIAFDKTESQIKNDPALEKKLEQFIATIKAL